MTNPGFIENFVNASAEGKIAYLEARLNAALDAFAGKPRVARHRLVYDALADELRQGIHALAIKAFTPEEFAEQFE
jgi:BolA protein